MDNDVSTVIYKDVIINNQAEEIRDQQKLIEDLTQDVKTLHYAIEVKNESKSRLYLNQEKFQTFYKLFILSILKIWKG